MRFNYKLIILLTIIIIFITVGGFTVIQIKNKIYSRNLIEAIEENNYERLSELLDKNGDINALPYINFFAHITERYNESPLFYACREGDLESVKLLLEYGADPNLVIGRYTPLMATGESLEIERFEIAILLIEYGADINYVDYWGKKPVLYFARGYRDNEDYESGYQLFLKFVSLNAIPSKNQEFYEGNYLIYAVSTNNVKIVDYLIENYNYDLNTVGKDGVTALIRATKRNAKDVVKYLIDNNVDVSAKDDNNRTAYDYAKEKNYTEIINLLEN